MKLHSYLESKHAVTAIINQTEYSPYNDATLSALQTIGRTQKKFYWVLAIISNLYSYAAIKLGLKAPLQDSKDIIKLYAEQKAAEVKKARENITVVPSETSPA